MLDWRTEINGGTYVSLTLPKLVSIWVVQLEMADRLGDLVSSGRYRYAVDDPRDQD